LPAVHMNIHMLWYCCARHPDVRCVLNLDRNRLLPLRARQCNFNLFFGRIIDISCGHRVCCFAHTQFCWFSVNTRAYSSTAITNFDGRTLSVSTPSMFLLSLLLNFWTIPERHRMATDSALSLWLYPSHIDHTGSQRSTVAYSWPKVGSAVIFFIGWGQTLSTWTLSMLLPSLFLNFRAIP